MAFPIIPILLFIGLIFAAMLLGKKIIAILGDIVIATIIYGIGIVLIVFFFGTVIPIKYYEIGYPILIVGVIVVDASQAFLGLGKSSSSSSMASGFKL